MGYTFASSDGETCNEPGAQVLMLTAVGDDDGKAAATTTLSNTWTRMAFTSLNTQCYDDIDLKTDPEARIISIADTVKATWSPSVTKLRTRSFYGAVERMRQTVQGQFRAV